jgi:Beta-lactamase
MTHTRRFQAPAVCVALAIMILFAGAAGAKPSADLTGIYRGNDGSALYVRQVGGTTSTVYAFGEHPGLTTAFIIKGTLAGDRVKGSWWDVPKGRKHATSKGAITLRWSPGGAGMMRVAGDDLGPDTWKRIGATGIAWPAPKLGPEFQSISGADLTGAYDGDDKSRHYVRETSFNVVWVAEKGFQPGERPGWVSVFTGKRQANGRVAGTWADVPKGLETRDGTFDALQVPGYRKLLLGGNARTRGLEPDYAVDFKKFGKGIEDRFLDKVTGFGYAIAKDGIVVAKGAGGYRLVYIAGKDKGLPFTPETQAGADSSTKLVTAAAVLKALAAKGISVDSKVSKYLPSCWAKGPGVADMTFRNLLGHTSLLYEPSNPACEKDPYRCLELAIKNGRQPERDSAKDGYDYDNINYALMRPILAFVVTDRKLELDFKLFKCKNTNDELNERFSAVFGTYVYGMLKSAGVYARFGASSDNRTYRYLFGKEKELGGAIPDAKKIPLRSAGAGGLWPSAVDYARFLSALDRGELVPPAMLSVMKSGRLGFERGCTLNGALGPCYWKNGGLKVDKGRGSESIGIILADGVQVYLVINSRGNAYKGYRGSLVLDAYYDAIR